LAARLGLAIAISLVSSPPCQAQQVEFQVEPRQVSVDESVRATLVLEGSLASIDSVDLPLTNLETSGPPSTSSQFTIVNGSMNRKKTFSWWVSPVREGKASVGPLKLETKDGGLVLVPAVEVSVLPPSDFGASTPAEAMDRLYLAGRDEVVLVAEADPSSAIVGQEVVVTWTLYSAVSLRGFAVSSIPKLDAFWVEEDLVDQRTPRSSRIGGHEVQKVEVRRASLFPLRDGELEIPPLEVRVEVIRPFRDPFGGFGLTEGRVAEVRRRSSPISVTAQPLPFEADAVGLFRISRTEPSVSPEGLVAFDVTVEGTGSLRSMPAPRLTASVAGEVEIQDAESDVTGRTPMRMRRTWRYVIFPRESGPLSIPSVETLVYAPGEASARVLSTAPATVQVNLSGGGGGDRPNPRPRDDASIEATTIAAAGVLLLAIVATVVILGRIRSGRAGELERIIAASGHTNTLRKRFEEAVTGRDRNPVLLYGESSELGDAWRAAMSLVDRLEKEPESIDAPEKEVRSRASRLIAELDAEGSAHVG
jgi:hypothetical protein